MKPKQFYILLCLPFIFVNLIAVFKNLLWLAYLCEILIFIPLLVGYSGKIDFKNLNFIAYFGLSFLAIVTRFFETGGDSYLISILFTMISYSFLIREALKYTRRETANKFMLFFFFLLISGNAYFVFRHLQELEIHMAGIIEFGIYSVYYINLLVLVIVALIYYLNSYSRKSVFFITLVMAVVVCDILRDMALFYLPDTSVVLMKSFLSIAGVILAFQFFMTEEKKLRLINLV
ncbi:hypothetical protein [Gramella sp. MAR_2010_147]|uniref:hypothetical protein n=1 Tax=Gramella sp. MAR_2010_147 TaxID=1250205 RepID=UPI0008795895|nr:hypothetical protein [Gramella sp. MAR_2010_147]SDR98241.1 hypothetical protein SAMN04488553_1187 [Gramella sp. MAR_2010_147]